MRTIELSNPSELGALKGSAKLNVTNFDKSGINFILRCPRIDSPRPYEYMEEIVLFYKGVKVFVGVVTECKQVLQGNSYVWQIAFSDRWWYLENSMFLGDDGAVGHCFRDPREPLGVVPPPGMPVTYNAPITVRLAVALEGTLKNAINANLIEAYDISLVDQEVGIESFSAIGSHADILRTIKNYRPGLISYFDYSRTLPTLVIAEQSRMPVYMLDIETHALGSIEITPRYDLVPKAVGIVYVSPTSGRISFAYPEGADLSQPGCIVHRIQAPQYSSAPEEEEEDKKGIDSPKWNFTKQSMQVRGRKLPSNKGEGKAFWEEKIPLLANVNGVNYLTPKAPTPLPIVEEEKDESYSASANQYELISGVISEKCKSIHWCKTRLEQWVEVRGGQPPLNYRHIFSKQVGENHWMGLLTWDGITTNVGRRSYTISPDDTGPEESDEPPEDTEAKDNQDSIQQFEDQRQKLVELCKSFWENSQPLAWDGTFISKRPPNISDVIGRSLSISGGRGEWQSINTVIQNISLDIYTGAISVTTGVPAHLSFDTILERSRLLDFSQQSSTSNNEGGLVDDEETKSGLDFQWDNRSKQIPKSPTVTPGGQVAIGEIDDGFEFGFQVRLIKNAQGLVTGSLMRHGYVYTVDGGFLTGFSTSGTDDNQPKWVDTGVIEGDIWIKVDFEGGPSTSPSVGKYKGMTIVGSGGVGTPFYSGQSSEFPAAPPVYYFHIANIKNGLVTQYAMGAVYIAHKPMTDYPYGPPI